LPTKRFFMVILLSTAQPSLRLYEQREPETKAAFVQRKERPRDAGMPHTLKEAHKVCKNSKSGRLILA